MDIAIENIPGLSNDDLFAMMKKAGLNAGPITASTRSVYEKKFRNFLETKENGLDKTTSNIESIAEPIQKAKEPKVVVQSAPLVDSINSKLETKIEAPKLKLQTVIKSPEVVLPSSQISTKSNIPIVNSSVKTVIDKVESVKPNVIIKPNNQSELMPTLIRSDNTSNPQVINSFYQESRISVEKTSSKPLLITKDTRNIVTRTVDKPEPKISSNKDNETLTQETKSTTEFRLLKPAANSIITETTKLTTNPTTILNRDTNRIIASSTDVKQSPHIDKFAERLKTYGMLGSTPSQTSSLNPVPTPSNIRSRVSVLDKPLETRQAVAEPRQETKTETQPIKETKDVAKSENSNLNFIKF